MPGHDRTLDVLAAFVHGAVSLGNALGAIYNLKRKHFGWVAVHLAEVGFHVYATLDHARDARKAQA